MPFIPDQKPTPGFIPDAAAKPTPGFVPDDQPDAIYSGLKSLLGKGAADAARGAAHKMNALAGSIGEGATLNNVKAQPEYQQDIKDNPTTAAIGHGLGGMVPGMIAGSAIGSMIPKAGAIGTAAMQSVGNVAGQVAQGAMQAPGEGQSRIGNAVSAVTDHPISTLASLLLPWAAPIAGVGKAVGAKFARMNPAQAQAYADAPGEVGQMAKSLEDPLKTPDLQNQARDAIQGSRKALRAQGLQGASQLSGQLQGKSIQIDPSEYIGIHPEADAIVNSAISNNPASHMSMNGQLPSSISIDANEANSLKRILQRESDFANGTVMDPVQKARYGDIASKASGLRQSIEQTGGEEVGKLNGSMQEGTLLSQALRKGLKTPLAFVSSESPDRVATLARAENRGAGGLIDFGNKLGAAKQMVSKDVGSGVPSFPLKWAGRLGIRAGNSAEQEIKELGPQLYQSLFGSELSSKK